MAAGNLQASGWNKKQANKQNKKQKSHPELNKLQKVIILMWYVFIYKWVDSSCQVKDNKATISRPRE